MNILRVLCFFLLAGLLVSFAATDDPIEKLLALFARYREELPQEKVYLHTDRPYYTSGDTIWFKAYLTAGPYHEPSAISRTIYVELINDAGKRLQLLKLMSVNGSATGDVPLADTLTSGNYILRAYTQWMRNTDEAYFFHRQVKIWRDMKQAASSVGGDVDVQFFPEGGNLVNGMLSRVGVKAVGTDGMGRSVAVTIRDEAGTEVAHATTNPLGMSSFFFTPQRGKQYSATIGGQTTKRPLPAAIDTGLVMTVKNLPQAADIQVRIQVSDFRIFPSVYLLAQTRGVVCYSAKADVKTPVVLIRIPKTEFPAGISQITVMDAQANPLAERLVFVNHQEQLKVSVVPDKPVYKPRENVTLTVTAEDMQGVPVQADLSLAVTDDEQVLISQDRESIHAYLLLASELQGYIESPGYYFNEMHDDRFDALDNLLLTQGWRRFVWTRALAAWPAPRYVPEAGLTIRGTLYNKVNDKPAANGKIKYLVTVPVPDTRLVRTDDNGVFEITDAIYFDSSRAVLNGELRSGSKEVTMVLQDPAFPLVAYPLIPLVETQTEFERASILRSLDYKAAVKSDPSAIMLKGIEIKSTRLEKEEGPERLYGKGTVSMNVEDDKRTQGLIHPLQLLQGRVAGVRVSGSGQNWDVQVQGAGTITGSSTPLFLIDNVPVSIETLSMLPASDVASIDVWKGPDAVIFGSRGGNGVIGFTTRKGKFSPRVALDFLSLQGTGYRMEREFYRPRYDVQRDKPSPVTYATLCWSPLVQTDSTGHATVTFEAPDRETTLTTVIEGLSMKGLPGATMKKLAVRQD